MCTLEYVRVRVRVHVHVLVHGRVHVHEHVISHRARIDETVWREIAIATQQTSPVVLGLADERNENTTRAQVDRVQQREQLTQL